MGLIELLRETTLYQNTAWDYVQASFLFIGAYAVLKFFQYLIVRHFKKLAEKTKTDFDDVVIQILRNIKPPLYTVVSLFIAYRTLTFGELVNDVIVVIFIVTVILEIVRAADSVVSYAITKYIDTEEGPEMSVSMLKSLRVIVKALLWIVGILLILSNLGINVTSLIASLGIGGLAIALALQKVLEDLFSSFSIYFDKPFVVGDMIVIGSDEGVVERIGLKTTRLRTLQGEQLIISNKELTNSRVQNFQRLETRRVVQIIGVTYDTPKEKLEKISALIEGVIVALEEVRFDRCHFQSYGDFSINFELVYYVLSSDYMIYMDKQEAVNFGILEAFEKEGIEFAFPTQTIIMQK